MEDKTNNKSGAILELIADLSIANKQLTEDYKNARTRVVIAENTIDKLRSAEIKMDRVLIRLKNMLKEGSVVTKEDIQDCIEILEND